MRLPSLLRSQEWSLQGFEQRLQQVLEKRARRVKGDRAVECVIQLPFAEAIDRLQELLEQCRPLILLRQLRGRAGAEQCLDLADRHAAIEPGDDVTDALDVGVVVQPVPLGRAQRHDKPVAALPGAQGHGVYAGDAGHFADGQQAVGGQLRQVRWFDHGQIPLRRLSVSGCGCR
jgi:hypothetical protein